MPCSPIPLVSPYAQPLGLRPGDPEGAGGGKKSRPRVPLFAFYSEEKQRHPDKVLLVRVSACSPSCGNRPPPAAWKQARPHLGAHARFSCTLKRA